MDLNQFTELYRRIQTNPSILLLGQGYLTGNGEEDPLWSRLVREDFPHAGLSPRTVDYPALWKTLEDAPGVERAMGLVSAKGDHLPPQPWLRAVLNLRWSLLYTSAIDGALAAAAGENYDLTWVSASGDQASRKYLNKNMNQCVALCGRPEHPPQLTTRLERLAFQNEVTKKLGWISQTYLRDFGVLVIDGWDPDHDWLTDELLLGALVGMPYDSIYWFGVPEQAHGELVDELVAAGILTLEGESFVQQMQRHMPELFELPNEQGEGVDPTFYTTLTLEFKGRHSVPIHIPRAKLNNINGDNFCLLDDEVLSGQAPTIIDRASSFAKFLNQTGLPQWNLFRTAPGELPFYFQRDKDEELLQEAEARLKIADGSKRKPLILDGGSNSGKTTMLANLALELAQRRKYPVFFIHGKLEAGAEKLLDDFIHTYFDTQRLAGERIEHVVVIWDGNREDYSHLHRALFARNALIIGTSYKLRRPNPLGISLEQNLSANETVRLEKILHSLGGDFFLRFSEVKKRWSEVKHSKRPAVIASRSLLYILQSVFRFEFDVEYIAVAERLKTHFGKEKLYTEEMTASALNKYADDYEKTLLEVAKKGFAASFQVQLDNYMHKHFEDARMVEQGIVETPEQKKLQKNLQLRAAIERLNRVLALAGEFGVEMPLSLLLRMMQSSGGTNPVYISDAAKIVDVLRTDSLIEFRTASPAGFGEEYYVRFRDPLEAENYICLMVDPPLSTSDHSTKRLDLECAILVEIMDATRTESDIYKLIELIREFGPNGTGKHSEDAPGNDYKTYQAYWARIANDLIARFEDEPEAVLVYAHFMRESEQDPSLWEADSTAVHGKELYENIRIRLKRALETLERDGKRKTPQFGRLQIELCANLQQEMYQAETFDRRTYDTIVSTVKSAYLSSLEQHDRDGRHPFSQNSMLDILLNAFACYVSSFGADRAGMLADREFQKELADRIGDIGTMLDLDELLKDRAASARIGKIFKIYDYMENSEGMFQQLAADVMKKNSDAYLFMLARRMWFDENRENRPNREEKSMAQILREDRYLAICRDTLSFRQMLRDSARTKRELERMEREMEPLARLILEDAKRVIAFLEAPERMEVIKKTRSERCIMMLLRAKWFCLSQNSLLGVKQRVALGGDQWRELIDLCKQFISFHSLAEAKEMFAPAYFLSGVDEWVNGDYQNAAAMFRKAKETGKSYGDDYINKERLVLCKEGEKAPRIFKVRLNRTDRGKYVATVREETSTPAPHDQVMNRRGINVPSSMYNYLFDSDRPKVDDLYSSRECTIRFNLSGAQLGFPGEVDSE